LIENETWLVDLYNSAEYDDEKLASTIHPINKFIIDDYEKNLDLNIDKNLIKDLLSSIISTIEFNNTIFLQTNFVNFFESPEIVANLVIDDHDNLYESDEENDENKNYSGLVGICYISSDISKNGIFWISPKLSPKYLTRYDTISKIIANFIKNTNQLNFDHLNKINSIPVKIGMKCFVKCFDKKLIEHYRRGLIESIDLKKYEAQVCLLDRGSIVTVKFNQMYPYAKLTDIDDIKFKTIRCSISNDKNLTLTESVTKLFNDFRQNSIVRYVLIEKVVYNNVICWYTGLQVTDSKFLNDILLHLNSGINVIKSASDNEMIGKSCNMSLEEQQHQIHSENEDKIKMLENYYSKNISCKIEANKPRDYQDYYHNIERNKNYQPHHPDMYEKLQQEQHQHYHVAPNRLDYLKFQENPKANPFKDGSKIESEKPFKSQKDKRKIQQEHKELNYSKLKARLNDVEKHALIHQISSFSKRRYEDTKIPDAASIYDNLSELNREYDQKFDEVEHVHSSLCLQKHNPTEEKVKLIELQLIKEKNEQPLSDEEALKKVSEEEKQIKQEKSRIIYSPKSFDRSKKYQDPKMN
jgi:hypothetical protein